jgi:hypothetical protein
MLQMRFRSPDGRDILPKDWLALWSALYPAKYDEAEYYDLISRHAVLTRTDFERIGQWKDGAQAAGKWKPNVAMVAYTIWMQAASEKPECPGEDRVEEFLEDWSKRNYKNQYRSSVQQKHFGLSRATTLLHFISGGRFPIFDSRVRRAVSRLVDSPAKYSIRWYLDSYCPMFSQITKRCGTKDVRAVDKALFSYGDRKLSFSN